jgi:biopolymer transport protein ExbD
MQTALRTAQVVGCRGERNIVLIQVLSHDAVGINGKYVDRRALEQTIQEIFKTRVYRYVLVTGNPEGPFRDIAQVVDTLTREMDYVVVVTPSVWKQLDPPRGTCLDPNLPHEYLRHPPRY